VVLSARLITEQRRIIAACPRDGLSQLRRASGFYCFSVARFWAAILLVLRNALRVVILFSANELPKGLPLTADFGYGAPCEIAAMPREGWCPSESEITVERSTFEGGVVDIAKSDHDLWILRQRDEDGRFVVAEWRGDHFQDLTEFERSPHDAPLALMSSAGSPTVLSGQTVRYLANDKTWRVVQLKGKLRSGVAVSAASPQEAESIYVGFNVGEWGGGLQRVDLKTGAVADIERRDTKDLCAGPLNRECDPVTGSFLILKTKRAS
jgi:hypothetical protein